MTLLAWIAAVVLFMQLPIPLYWFVLHPARNFWRTRRTSAYIVALALSWLPVTLLLLAYHRQLLRRDTPPVWRLVLGTVLIVLEIWIFWSVKRDLGGARLVGAAELSGGGKMEERGIYSKIRHPRYSGSFFALVGACLFAGTQMLWFVLALWTVLMLVAIAMEEKDLHSRFGAPYLEYCRRVPRFIPRLALQRQNRGV